MAEPLVTNQSVAEVWVPSSDLPVARPWGIAISPDGNTVYASCMGNVGDVTDNMTNGGVVAIDTATKAVTAIVGPGRTGMKQGIDCDSSGNVYWSDSSGLYKWDGSTSTLINEILAWGMCIHEDVIYVNNGNVRTYDLTGTFLGQFGTNIGGAGNPHRGIAVTADWVFYTEEDNFARYNRSTGTTTVTFNGGMHKLGAVAVSETEGYLTGQRGFVVQRLDPSTGTVTNISPASIVANPWCDMVIAPQPRRDALYISAGGVISKEFFSQTDGIATDTGTLPDTGILKLRLPLGGWHVGLHAVRM